MKNENSIFRPLMTLGRFLTVLVTLCLPGPIVFADDTPAKNVSDEAFFQTTVLPILQQHCYECHSHGAKKAKGGLVLDSRSGWAKGGETGPAIVPGKPNKSLLISAIRYEDYEMPPTGRLPEELIRKIERWIADGAHDPRATENVQHNGVIDIEAGRRHWAFQPPRSVTPPEVRDTEWPRHDVDRYILGQLEEAGLRPVADANRYTWLRRVSFDLTGLPPTVAEISEFETDQSPQAREKVVDRLLASRAFGERWARHWLDLVGYADQLGTSNNVFAEHAWRYRDYVIDALNNDKPFDRFIREQIAGDLLTHSTTEQRASSLVATGFLVLGDIEIVEADKEKLLVDIVDQQLNKVGKAFLGLTLECARCHDHKFDPVPQRDYYAMAGFFHGTSTVYKTSRGVWSDIHVAELPETDDQKNERNRLATTHAEKLKRWQQERKQAQDRTAELNNQLKQDGLSQEERDKLTKERDETSGRIGPLNNRITHGEFFAPAVPRTYAIQDADNPGDMKITIRGNPRALGDQVPRGFLRVASDKQPQIPKGRSGRRELADWIASSDNPLSARVAVNRIWQKLFGEGLVRSVDYFGLPGDRPSHPQLLDHLAIQFTRGGWSRKHLIRSLVLSRTYGLDSAHDDRAHAVDPDNRLLWRMNRFRLDAEALRDAMIFVAGQLVPSVGGPAMPLEFPENVGGLSPTNVNPPNFRLTKWRPEQEFQRTVYLPVIRSGAQPGPATLRNVFDFAQPSQFTGQRSITAVPTQALFLMNSSVVKKHAAALAEQMMQEDDETQRLKLLWLTLLNRPLTETEQHETTAFLTQAGENAWVELCHALLASNEFLMRL
ncbi:MAG: DUF1549 domain-containing protein [Fuerstiella sp.]